MFDKDEEYIETIVKRVTKILDDRDFEVCKEKEIEHLKKICSVQKFSLNTYKRNDNRATYAAMFLQGILSYGGIFDGGKEHEAAKLAVSYANALIEELEKYYD